MGQAPPELVQKAFVAPVADIIRRVEIYESDAQTPWRPELWEEILVGGAITVDMTRDERRAVDLELDNSDGDLDPKVGGFWYDKILKVFYGIRLHEVERDPRVIIVDDAGSALIALYIKALLHEAGVQTVLYEPTVSRYEQVVDYDIVISITDQAPSTAKLALLNEAFNRGKSVFSVAGHATAAQLPGHILATGAVVNYTDMRRFTKLDIQDPAANGWGGSWVLETNGSFRPITQVAPGAIPLLESTVDEALTSASYAAILRRGDNGQAWVHYASSGNDMFPSDSTNADFVRFLGAMVRRMDYVAVESYWETQIGEFVPDNIDDADDYGDRLRFVGRDYTARCVESRLSKATMFTAAQSLEAVITAVARNAGIRKISLPATNKTLGKDMTWEADTERWKIMNDVALAGNYELYFTGQGVLTMREQQDPLLTPTSLKLTTGEGGNLVRRSAKTSGKQIYNHVVVVGESSDSTAPLVFAEVSNNDPSSPTAIDKIGMRSRPRFSSPMVTTDAQALELARTMLSVSALEEFEMSFDAVLLPWAEPGEIVETVDPEGTYWGPTRYLLSTLNLPLDLGPMSGTAKRVVKVG